MKKPKANEPSLRDKLSAKFDADLLADYEAHGREAIAKVREKYPENWVDAVGRRISANEPKADGYGSCQSLREIGIKLLKEVGCDEFEMTEDMIEAAMAANEAFIERLKQIKAEAEGALQ